MWETWVWSLDWEDSLEKGQATHSMFSPGKFHVLYSLWGCKESDTTEWLSLSLETMVTKAGGLLWNQDNSKDPYIKHLWVFMLSLNHYTFSFITNFLSLCYVLGTKLSILYAFCMVSCSVNFSCSVMSDSLQPHGLQHGRLPCPSVIPRAYLNSCPLSRWHHPTISSSVVPFFSCLQSFPVAQLCPTLCNPVDCSPPDLPVHHQLPEFTQTHVHWVGDAIQPSHPLSSPSPPDLSLSQHQGLFKWVSSSHQVAKVLGVSAST